MGDPPRNSIADRDVDQSIVALKKGAYLLKYGRRGKPKFCPFQLSNDESTLIWYSGKEEKQLKLGQVSKIIPGQRTSIFQRYPRPEKEYQSFSLIYSDRSLDLICKDKDEAEVWFVGLKALISRGNNTRKWRIDRTDASLDSPRARARKTSPSITPFDPEPVDGQGNHFSFDSAQQNRLGKAFSDIISYTSGPKNAIQSESAPNLTSLTASCVDTSNGRNSTSEAVRISLSSAVSSSSQGSCHEDFDALGDVFIWGEGIGEGLLGGGAIKIGNSSNPKVDAPLPKALESMIVLDIHNIACGGRHAVLVTKQGEMFSWGEESGGRLGHGVEADVPHPKLIENLSGMNIELIACGAYHTCAIAMSGELYTWGDGTFNFGLLGHGSEASHWVPKKVSGDLEGMHISFVSCGLWHTAAVTSTGQLFTFGDGTFGVLGHGYQSSASVPREVEALKGLRTTRVACGPWHTAAVVEMISESSSPVVADSSSSGKLFTWGDGDKGRLGHGDLEPRFVPQCVAALNDVSITKVACGHHFTLALTAAGRVYTMGSTAYDQVGSDTTKGKIPSVVGGKIADCTIEEIACGSYHIAVLSSKSEVYTWGKGTNGQLGHGDIVDRNAPTRVEFLRNKQVKTIACGSNFTAAICLHKWVSSADHLTCTSCQNPFGFRRKRHNCYNCGLVFCKACSSRKALKASLAPNMNKPYRVCDDCFTKLNKPVESSSMMRIQPKSRNGNMYQKTNEVVDKESWLQKQPARTSNADSTDQTESRHPRPDKRIGLDGSRVFPTLGGKFRTVSLYSSKPPPIVDGGTKDTPLNPSPDVGMSSYATSPFSGGTSNSLSPELSPDDSKNTNVDLNEEEIMSLRAQIGDLNSKVDRLQAELEKKSRKLKEVTAIAEDEAQKRKSAKEVIKSLTTQLKEMAERLPEGENVSHTLGFIAQHATSMRSKSSGESHSTNSPSREVEANCSMIDNQILSNGSKAHDEKTQWAIQAEPGVYITLSSLPGGVGHELKRVRFSRKHFTVQEAEKWWAENGSQVCEKYNISQNTE